MLSDRNAAITALSKGLEKNRATIEGVPKKTFGFGPAERNQIDVYYPTTSEATAPVLVFIYGGGFVSGERAYPPPLLAYANLAAFFARRGFFVAIPDYTLVPAASFPLPPSEVRDAVAWIVSQADEIAAAVSGSAKLDTRAIHTLGHSAGATHLSTAYLLPELVDSAQGKSSRDATQTLVLSGPAVDLGNAANWLPPPVIGYYGGAISMLHPLALLESASAEVLHGLPRVVIVLAEREPDGLEERVLAFKATLEQRLSEIGGGKGGWREVKVIRGKGHNHISINWALSTGEGEEWGKELIAIIKSS